MRILWVDPIGTDRFLSDVANILRWVRREGTEVDVMYLGPDRPKHLEYHAYEAMVIGDIVRLTYAASAQHDAIVIGCFYDVGLREAREVSRQAVVTAVPARSGEVRVEALKDGSRVGVLVIARDDGPGIQDVERAMEPGFSTSGGLGLGLPGVRRLMDDMKVESKRGRGTSVTARKWLR